MIQRFSTNADEYTQFRLRLPIPTSKLLTIPFGRSLESDDSDKLRELGIEMRVGSL